MSKQKADKKSKRDVLAVLIRTVGDITVEQERLKKKLENIHALLKLLQEKPDGDWDMDDLDMDTEVDLSNGDDDDDEPEELEFDGVIFKLGEQVQMKDPKTRRWRGVGRLVKFNDHMATVEINGGKKTRRKYGNFRHFLQTSDESE